MVLAATMEIEVCSPTDQSHKKSTRDCTEQPKGDDGKAQGRIPRIILRNTIGHLLDTDTGLQRAIGAARLRRNMGELPKEAFEWRLPHSFLPARPDLSREVAHMATERIHRPDRVRVSKWDSLPDLLESADTERKKDLARLSFNLGQMETLPPLVAASLLHKSMDRERRIYVPFVTSAPLSERAVSETDVREHTYAFPGFCSGCVRHDLCYGCLKEPSRPHFHDISRPVRTGGGFTYLQRDIMPVIPSKNPSNWRVAIQPNSIVHLDELTDLERYALKLRVGEAPFGARADLYNRLLHAQKSSHSHLTHVTTAHSSGGAHFHLPAIAESAVYKSRLPVSLTPDDLLSEADMDVDSGRGATVADSNETLHKADSENYSTRHEFPDIQEEVKVTDDQASEAGDTVTVKLTKDKTKKKVKAKNIKAPTTHQMTDLTSGRKKTTKAKSPFSSDREYSIPGDDGFTPKKSSKEVTQFEDFDHGDRSWKEPSKFEVQYDGHFLNVPEPEEDADRLSSSPSSSKKASRQTSRQVSRQATSQGGEASESLMVEKPAADEDDRPRSSDSGVVSEAGADGKSPYLQDPDDQERDDSEDLVTTGSKQVPPKPAAFDWSKARKEAVNFVENEDAMERIKDGLIPTTPATPTTPRDSEPKKKKQKRQVVKKEGKKDRKRARQKEKKPAEMEAEEQVDAEEEAAEDLMEDQLIEDEPILEVIVATGPRPKSPPPPRKVEPPPLPELRPVEPPEFSEYAIPDRPNREISRTLIEAPPTMPEPPKQRRPAELKRQKKKVRERKRVLPTGQSVAPVTKDKLKTIVDPLDYLAKYCIIHPDRLPLYEHIFNSIIKVQVYRYNDVPHPEGHTPSSAAMGSEGRPTPSIQAKATLNPQERHILDELCVMSKATRPEFGMVGQNSGDQLITKVNYTLETLMDKYESLQDRLDELQAERLFLLATVAKATYPKITDPNFDISGKKKGKKKKQKTAGLTQDMQVQTDDVIGGPVTDMDIVRKLDAKALNKLQQEPSLAALNLEIQRLQEKLKDVDDRIEDLEDEKKILQLYARDIFSEESNYNKPGEFRRQQSALYNKMHPDKDPEMNLNELEEALQQINGQLITEKEMQYIFHILDLPGRRRINVQLFSVIAALSEKVVQLDPLIRKLINKFDFEALDVKMDKCKELFDLLDEQDFDVPNGMIKARNLLVELTAGGLAPENTEFVEKKFNREQKGIVDFLDFLTYIPLFIEIHTRIVRNPLLQQADDDL